VVSEWTTDGYSSLESAGALPGEAESLAEHSSIVDDWLMCCGQTRAKCPALSGSEHRNDTRNPMCGVVKTCGLGVVARSDQHGANCPVWFFPSQAMDSRSDSPHLPTSTTTSTEVAPSSSRGWPASSSSSVAIDMEPADLGAVTSTAPLNLSDMNFTTFLQQLTSSSLDHHPVIEPSSSIGYMEHRRVPPAEPPDGEDDGPSAESLQAMLGAVAAAAAADHLPGEGPRVAPTTTAPRESFPGISVDGSVSEGSNLTPTVFCPDCGLGFVRASSMRQHVAIAHEGTKAFVCDKCGKRFTEMGHMRLHVKTVHGNSKPHACHLCNRDFSTGSNLRMHIRVVHPIIEAAEGFESVQAAEMQHERLRTEGSKSKLGRPKQRRSAGDHLSVQLPLPTGDLSLAAAAVVAHEDWVIDEDGNRRKRGAFICNVCGGAYGSLGTLRSHSRNDHNVEIPMPPGASCRKRRGKSPSREFTSPEEDEVDMTGRFLDHSNRATAAIVAAAAAAATGVNHIATSLPVTAFTAPRIPALQDEVDPSIPARINSVLSALANSSGGLID
jgi:hypothetical protein